MSLPLTVSLEVPYVDNEQQFLVLAVQTAVRAFRTMNAISGAPSVCLSSPLHDVADAVAGQFGPLDTTAGLSVHGQLTDNADSRRART
jgi:hypothetical protein